MGSIALDNGESVYVHDGTGSADPVAISAAEGSSVANLMKNRERFDYTWANSTERTGQTGMVQGSRGYQEDTKTEYLYENSQWRIAVPYSEFTSPSVSAVDGNWTTMGSLSIDSTQSTSTTFITSVGSNGGITIVDPGLYVLSAFAVAASATAGVTLIQMSSNSDPNNAASRLARGSFVNTDDTATLTTIQRVAAANTPYYFAILNNSGGSRTINTRIKITRLG